MAMYRMAGMRNRMGRYLAELIQVPMQVGLARLR